MKKALKSLAFCLSFLMVLNLFAVVPSVAESTEDVVVTTEHYGANEFKDMAAAGLTTELDGKYSASGRAVSVGNHGYGIWAYLSPSVGNYLSVTAGHTYLCEAQVWVDDYISPDPSTVNWTDSVDNWFNADCWVYAPIDKTYTSTPLTKEAYEKAPVFYDETYGYPYKTIEMTIEIPATDTSGGETIIPSGQSEFRFYTNGFTKFKHYRMYVYDLDVDPFTPVLDMDASISNPYNVADHLADPENYVECDNLSLNPGLYFSAERAKDCADTVLVGNAGKTLSKGNYAFEYALDYTYIKENSTVFTVKITKDGQPFDEKTFTDKNLPEDGIISVPFTVDEEGDYRAALCVNSNASFTLKSVDLKRTVNMSYFDRLRDAVNAIGEVKYDPDIPVDSGDLIKEARKAYDDTVAELGDLAEIADIAKYYGAIVDAEATYSNLVNEYNDMVKTAQAVDETIDSIEDFNDPENAELVIVAKDAFDGFIGTYGDEKAKIHIKNYDRMINLPIPIPPTPVNYGDVDGSGEIDTTDALWALQAFVGSRTLDEKAMAAADVNIDGIIDTSDALAILQFAVKLRDKLPTVDIPDRPV